MIDNAYVENVLLYNKGFSLVGLWLASKKYPPFKGDLNLSKKGFFYMTEKFMNEGILKLAHQDEFLKGSIKDQLKLFEQAWPKKYDDSSEENDIDNLWWLLFAPAGAVWLYPDGKLVWT